MASGELGHCYSELYYFGGSFLADGFAGFGALLGEKLDHTLIAEGLGAVERRAAGSGHGVDVDAELGKQLNGFERGSFALGAGRLRPGTPAAHAGSRHQRGQRIAAFFEASAENVFGMMYEQRVGALLDEQSHDGGLGEAGGEPERRRADQRGME